MGVPLIERAEEEQQSVIQCLWSMGMNTIKTEEKMTV
jgi:hypothetical protein